LKILFIGNVMGFSNAHKHYMIWPKLMQGLIRCGHAVYVFNERDYARATTIFRSRSFGARNIPKKLLQLAADLVPDLIILAHAEMIPDETIIEIRRQHPAVRIIYLNVDSLAQGENIRKIARKVGIADGIFITTADPYLRQLETNKTFIRFFPNPVDPSVDVGRSFDHTDHQFDIFFAGGRDTDNAEDPRRRHLQVLQRNLGDLRLGFFGSAVKRPFVWGAEYLSLIGASKIGLSFDRNNDYSLYSSDRMVHYLGNGLLTCLLRGRGFERWFDEDEVIYFSDMSDLEVGIRAALKDDKTWRDRARRAWTKAHRLFSSDRIGRYMVETTFGMPLSESYEWPTGSL